MNSLWYFLLVRGSSALFRDPALVERLQMKSWFFRLPKYNCLILCICSVTKQAFLPIFKIIKQTFKLFFFWPLKGRTDAPASCHVCLPLYALNDYISGGQSRSSRAAILHVLIVCSNSPDLWLNYHFKFCRCWLIIHLFKSVLEQRNFWNIEDNSPPGLSLPTRVLCRAEHIWNMIKYELLQYYFYKPCGAPLLISLQILTTEREENLLWSIISYLSVSKISTQII